MININKIYQWSRINLFSNWYNSVISLIIIYCFIVLLPQLFNWLFFDATFKGSSSKECYGDALAGYSLLFGLKSLFMVYIQIIKYGELI